MIEDNCGVKFSLVIDGSIVNFSLVLVEVENPFYKKQDLKLGFISDDHKNLIKSSLYSGGETGFGLGSFSDIIPLPHKNYAIVETDIDEVIEKWNAYQAELERKEEEKRKCNQRIVDAVNELPTEFPVIETKNYSFKIHRLPAKMGTFVPVLYTLYVRQHHKANSWILDMDKFIDKNGNLRKAKIRNNRKELIGDNDPVIDPVYLIEHIIYVKNKVANIITEKVKNLEKEFSSDK